MDSSLQMKDVTRCPMCKHREYVKFYNYGYANPSNRVKTTNVICKNCGLVFLTPRPSAQWMTDYYNTYLEQTQEIEKLPVYLEDHLFSLAEMRAELLLRYLNKDNRVLDIGCGYGILLETIRRKASFQLTLDGLNPEISTVLHAQKYYSVNIQASSVETFEAPLNHYDMIIMDNVIEHLDDQGAILEKLHGLLKSKGKLFISTNNVNDLHGFPWQNFFNDHTVTYSPKTLSAHLRSHGFDPVFHDTSGHITYEGYRYPYQNCIAQKTDKPAQFDFGREGEDHKQSLQRLKNYNQRFRVEAPWSKRLFELNNSEMKPQKGKAKLLLESKVRRLKEKAHVLFNHTLPPEKYVKRRVVLVIFHTENDEALAIKLIIESGLNPEYLFLKKTNFKYTITKATPFIRRCCNNILPDFFNSPENAWQWLEGSLPSIKVKNEFCIERAEIKKVAYLRIIEVLKIGKSLSISIRKGEILF